MKRRKKSQETNRPFVLFSGDEPYDPRDGFTLAVRLRDAPTIRLFTPKGELGIRRADEQTAWSDIFIDLRSRESGLNLESARALASLISALTGCVRDIIEADESEFQCTFLAPPRHPAPPPTHGDGSAE